MVSGRQAGIFVHWGLYSIPAFAEETDGDFTTFMRDLTAMKDTHGAVPYAEWYLNALRIPGLGDREYHERTFGRGVSYFDLRRRFEADAARSTSMIGRRSSPRSGLATWSW